MCVPGHGFIHDEPFFFLGGGGGGSFTLDRRFESNLTLLVLS